ncbi:MAG TPA: tetratricopeptide repeat protein, partial [Caldimonas sp.]
ARVPWAIHAVAHVMEMQGRHDEGARWLADLRAHWGARAGEGRDDARNGFAGHLGWHEALFALETLDTDAALRIFDTYLGASDIEITLQRVDAASLLWRIDLLGADVGARWRALLVDWRLDSATAGHSLFNDAHAALALIGAGELAEAREWVALSLAGADRQAGWNREVVRAIGAPLMHGLLAFGEGRYAAAAETIAPVRARLAPFGGSRAQRDVVDQTLLAAAARGGLRTAGRALLDERRRAKPATPLTAHWARRLGGPSSLDAR